MAAQPESPRGRGRGGKTARARTVTRGRGTSEREPRGPDLARPVGGEGVGFFALLVLGLLRSSGLPALARFLLVRCPEAGTLHDELLGKESAGNDEGDQWSRF